MKPKNTICLWFDKDAREAARFYAVTFPDSRITAVHEAPSDTPGTGLAPSIQEGPRKRRRYADLTARKAASNVPARGPRGRVWCCPDLPARLRVAKHSKEIRLAHGNMLKLVV